MTLSQWASLRGLTTRRLWARLKRGWPLSRALSLSVEHGRERTRYRTGKSHPQYKHGMRQSRIWKIWASMCQRCCDPNCKAFRFYGGRGIRVSTRWVNDPARFAKDMGPCPPGYTLERKNNDGPYSKRNCRWASRLEQARNRRSSRRLTFAGKTMCLAAWAEELGLRPGTLSARLNNLKWSVGRALTAPVKGNP